MSKHYAKADGKDNNQIDLEIENKMRIFANLILDKFFEDKKNNSLKFKIKRKSEILLTEK